MEPKIEKKIRQFLQEEDSKKHNLTQFVETNLQFVVENSPQESNLPQFWADAIQKVSNEIGVQLGQKRRIPDWKAIVEKVSSLQRVSESNLSSSRGTKRKSSSKTDSCELSEADKEKAVESYTDLEDLKKWKFVKDDGEDVMIEDVMLKHVQKCEFEHAALSMILNIDDPIWLTYFTKSEMKRLGNWRNEELDMPKLPNSCQKILDDCKDIVKSIIEDNKECAGHILEKCIVDGISTWLETLKTFNKYKEYNEYWLVSSINEFCDMFRWNVPARLGSQSSEIDFTIQIWSQLDKCFRNLIMDTRRDVSCVATSVRANEDRKLDGLNPIAEQQRTVRPDLVLSKNDIEFGAGECGKTDLAGIGKKELVETRLHSPKVLKDMFVRAAKKVDNPEDFIRSFQIVGFNQTHLRMSVTLLDSPSGYVCRARTSQEYQFPTSATLFCAGVLPILALTLKAKLIVEKSVNLLQDFEINRGTIEPSFEYFAAKDSLQIPPCFTPSNKKPKPSMPTMPTMPTMPPKE